MLKQNTAVGAERTQKTGFSEEVIRELDLEWLINGQTRAGMVPGSKPRGLHKQMQRRWSLLGEKGSSAMLGI